MQINFSKFIYIYIFIVITIYNLQSITDINEVIVNALKR